MGGGPTKPAKPAKKGQSLGLSTLCEQMLGAPLDKRMQLSNWARRPLVPQQRAYAALDAHCLVLLHAAFDKTVGSRPNTQ